MIINMIQKQFKSIVVAQIFSALAVTVCLLIDGMLTSKFLGEDAMAAFGMAGALIFLFAAIGGTIAAGAQIVSSKALGQGDAKEANASFSSAVATGFVISIISVVIVMLFADPISVVLGAVKGTTTQALTRDYLVGYMIGCPAFVLIQTLNPFLQLSGKKKVVLLAVALMIVADVGSDLLNVFVFHQGTFGMGVASSLSYYASFVVAAVPFIKKKISFSMDLKLFSLSIMKKIAVLGATYAVYQVCRALFRLTANHIFMRHGGETLVATFSVINTVYEICLSAGMGIAATVLMMSGVFYGEGNRNGLDNLIRMFVKYLTMINCGIIAVVIIFANPIIALFSSDASLTGACVTGLRIIIIAILPFSFSACMRSFYQGIQKTFLSQVICVIQNYVMGVAMILLAQKMLGNDIFPWVGIVAGESFTVIFILILTSIINRRLFRGFADLDIADASVRAINPEAEFILHNQKEATEVASMLQEISANLGLRSADAMAIAMCVEEMGANTFFHGSSKSKDETQIEVRVMKASDGISVTMTDNSSLFDPVGYYEQHKDDKKDGHIGIRNVRKLAKDMNYINMFGLNCVTIKI